VLLQTPQRALTPLRSLATIIRFGAGKNRYGLRRGFIKTK
jgi:hypothetical protein